MDKLLELQNQVTDRVAEFQMQYDAFIRDMDIMFPIWKQQYNEERKIFNSVHGAEKVKETHPHFVEKHSEWVEEKESRQCFYQGESGVKSITTMRCSQCQALDEQSWYVWWKKPYEFRVELAERNEERLPKAENLYDFKQTIERQIVKDQVRKMRQDIEKLYMRPRVFLPAISYYM